MTNQVELMTQLEEAQKKIAELELEKKIINKKKEIEIKVSQKGCVQINGIRKFPITFYKEEMEKIFNMKPQIEKFMEDNSNELATK